MAAEKVEIEGVVFRLEEDLAALIPTLSDMVGDSG